MNAKYPLHRDADVVASPHFPSIETDILAYWGSDGTFQASIDNRANDPEFVFYDGPPFANGLPHYGHLLTGYAKDVVPRFETMRGKKVERRFGWDTHGLPAELEAERILGITDKSQIEEMGIARVQQGVPGQRAQVHQGVGGVRHPPGALGGLRERLQDARRHLHGVRDLGLQAALRQGPRVRGLPRAPVLLEGRDAAQQPRAAHGRRRLPVAPGPRADRRAAAQGRAGRARRREPADLDDDAVDASVEPRRRRWSTHRLFRGSTHRGRVRGAGARARDRATRRLLA